MMIENLENRQLMSATLNATTGLLSIIGTPGDDAINVSVSLGKVNVSENGVLKKFDATKVKKIYANGKWGYDAVILQPSVFIRSELHGGGNDYSPSGGDYLQGGSATTCCSPTTTSAA